ncbi:MAG: hypothetical protein ACRDV7_06680 [Acidimicrobiia bacterium]
MTLGAQSRRRPISLEIVDKERTMMKSRSRYLPRPTRVLVVLVIVLTLGTVSVVSATDSGTGTATVRLAPPAPAAPPDIINPWAAGDAAIARLLDACRAAHAAASSGVPAPTFTSTTAAATGCEMFAPERIARP